MVDVSRRSLLGGTALAGALANSSCALSTGLPSGKYRIDLHAHFLPPEYRDALVASDYPETVGLRIPEWSVKDTLHFMDRYGIEAQVLSISDPGVKFLPPGDAVEMARYCNDYAADLMREHPTRFGAFAVLPLPDVDASVAELERALTTLRFDGVILLSSYDGVYLADERFQPLMAALERHRAYVFVHPAAVPTSDKPELPIPDAMYEYTFDTTRTAAALMFAGLIDRYPSIRFQLAHAGGTLPFLAYRLALFGMGAQPPVPVAEHLKGFFYDTALSPTRSSMASALAVGDLQRIVFGTDWPFSGFVLTGYGDPQRQLSDTFSAEQRVQVERENALRQLPRLARALGRRS